MYNNNMINTLWDKDNECSNGLNAMFYALEYYNNNISSRANNIMSSIINYNEIDCKVMYEILKFLRNNYNSIQNQIV